MTDISDQKASTAASEKELAHQLGWQYRHELINYIKKFLSSSEEIDDIVQETFLRLTKKPPDHDKRDKLKAYMFVIAANLVKDRLRRTLTRHEKNHVDVDDVSLFNDMNSPESSAISEQLKLNLIDGLKELPEQYRQVFIMHRFMHMSNQQIAQRLAVSVRTVERRMVYAVDHMRSQLRDYL